MVHKHKLQLGINIQRQTDCLQSHYLESLAPLEFECSLLNYLDECLSG